MSDFSGKIVEYGRLSEDSVARFPLGALVETVDGRKFRYCQNSSAAIAAGKLYQAPALVANHQNIAVASAASIGDLSVTVTLGATAATANDYSEGLMVVNDEAGEGHCYRVKSHPAADASASLVLTLEDPIKVALTTSSEVCLIPNLYKKPVISDSGQAGTAVGVAPFAITADYFGWLQTHGMTGCLADENVTAGQALTIGSSTDGSVEAVDADTEPKVGVASQACVDGEYRMIFLQID